MKSKIKTNRSKSIKYPWLPVDYQNINYTPEELWKKAVEFFEFCDKEQKPKTLSWLQLYCWVGDNFFNEKQKSQEFSGVVGKINLVLENYLEEQLITGRNWTNIQFLLNNRFKGRWIAQSNMKIEATGIHPDIKDVLDRIIKKK